MNLLATQAGGGVMGIEVTAEQALRLWHDVGLGQILERRPDLTTRQMTILLTVYLEPPPHTVRGLAARLAVTKPVITRALDSMGRLGLVRRRRDEHDRRNVFVQRTVEGSLFLESFCDLVRRKASELTR
jgi:DNA-binding MarR family transcriptional regulator